MSFSRSFTFYVSGNVDYPASEKGGSVSYSDSVDVTVDVDTSDFEESVRRCDRQVGHLRDSVVETALHLVKEKSRSAKKIASSMVCGFYKYIRYEIREKMMQLVTRVPMLLQALKNLAGHCSSTRSQLEKDYQQITSRYAKIFDDLQINLKSALVGLDQPVYQLSEQANGIVLSSALQLTATRAVLTGPEQSCAVNALEVAQVKGATKRVVSEGARNIMYNIKLGRQIDHMLRKSAIGGEHRFYMPVVRIDSSSLDDGRTAKDFIFSGAFPCSCAANLHESVRMVSESDDTFVNTLASVDSASSIDRFFRTRLSKTVSEYQDSDMAARFSAEVLRMWDSRVEASETLSDKED